MTFFLGTHETSWLGFANVPLFVSRRRLSLRKSFTPAVASWALDSGGFTELSMFGEWRTKAKDYIAEVRRWVSEIGKLSWAAAMDWMCEPFILEKTGLTVEEHQKRTVDNYIDLRMAAPEIPWTPVLQGWCRGDYERHVDQYLSRGVDLKQLPVVGIGSVCRRQHTMSVELLIRSLKREGLKLHGFGFKMKGLANVSNALESADSLAWSYDARRSPAIQGHTHKNCANCLEFALEWRERCLDRIESTARQGCLL